MQQELEVVENVEPSVKVSVIIPVYNAADYLSLALESVIDQTLKEIEIICVDDGSTDRSLAIVKEYAATDARIRIVTENNAGVAIARNNGIRRARGEYIAFLDADDFMEAPMLERLYLMAKEKKLDIAIANYDLFQDRTCKFVRPIPSEHENIFADGRVSSKNEYPDVIFQAIDGSAWNKLWRKEFLVEKELCFLADAKMFEDIYFVCTALSLAERVGKLCDGTFMHHRVYNTSARNRFFRKYFRDVPLVYAKIKEFLMAHGMYLPLQKSFMNLSASRMFKIYNILPSDAKAEYFDLLHTSYVKSFGWNDLSSDSFRDHEVGEFIVSVAMYNHTQYRKRESKGRRIKLHKIPKLLKNFKTKEKIKAFFAKIFGKKKKKGE